MKKKVIAATLATAMTVGLSGCLNSTPADDSASTTTKAADSGSKANNDTTTASDNSGVTSEQITLRYVHCDDETTVNLLAEKFMELYPNITVETSRPDDVAITLSSLASEGKFPDCFTITDVDYSLSNAYWADISEYWDADPETKNLMSTINEYGIGCYDTEGTAAEGRYSAPMIYWPSAMFLDRNVFETLNVEMPSMDWTWDEMVQLIKDTTDLTADMAYYGLGYYNRLDSLYGIAANSTIKGEFGWNGKKFDLSIWARGEQEFADLKLGGYVAPQQATQRMENWTGDWDTWFGSTGHVAMFSEGFWSYMNIWGLEGYQEEYGLDIVPYVTPKVEADAEYHNVISTMLPGGISTSTEHPKEAYELLKFMGWGIDGWKARLEIYNDTSITNASGTPLKNSQMPVPITLDEGVWEGYKALFPQDADHKVYWDAFFDSIQRPVPYGWQSIAGYWNFCDQYFNKIGIHDLVDQGTAKAADYADEATEQANYYHKEAMKAYFNVDVE